VQVITFLSRPAAFVLVLSLVILGPVAPVAAQAVQGIVNGDIFIAQTSPQPKEATEPDDEINDPLEPMNRAIFEFNEFFLEYILGPISTAYVELIPPTGRQGINNLLHHLSSPVVLANDILQGEFQRALETLGRTVVNTVVGFGGVVDISAELGVKRHNEDFGQTLGVWGVGEGFYLVLPIFGPSNPRDAVGKLLVDSYLDPLGLWLSNTDRDVEKWSRTGVKGVDEYSNVKDELAQVKKTSIDYYAAIRSLYRQKRKSEISNGRDIKLPPIPDLTISHDFDVEPVVEGASVPKPGSGANGDTAR
jgi:phospholipid-binding lipoprotein MlaA